MKRSVFICCLLVVMTLLFVGCGGGKGGTVVQPTTGSIKVVNNSSSGVTAVYIAPTSEGSWGQNLISGQVLATGESHLFENVAPGRYDSKVTMSSGNSYTVYNVEVVAGALSVIVNPSTNTRPVLQDPAEAESTGRSEYVAPDGQGPPKD